MQAQTIEDARKLFAEGKYAEAVPLFETIVKSTAKKTAIYKPESYRSLGDCYYFLYEFEKSVLAYSQCADLPAITPQMERSKRAARMLSRCEDIQIIDSVIMNKNDFLKTYFMSSECGSLTDENGRISYENPLKDKRYFSAKNNKNGKYRLYSEINLQGMWEDRRELNLPSDTSANDNYPFVLQDGLTLYFASTGENSIGGYDLFVTRSNLNNDTYLTPNQLGMPFNSIFNDYMLAIDEIHNTGYFATDRFQPEGKVVIYTFIPNEQITPIQTENEKTLIDRAKITSIRDSWPAGKNYKSYLAGIRQSIANENKTGTNDFFFVLNDQTVYNRLNDFKDDGAKQAFLQSAELEKNRTNLKKELDALRLEYAQASNAKKETMKANILTKEKRLEELESKYKQALANARNFELRRKRN
ncbi:hypothetical protein AGMMS50262_16440 [Bacteroidia bacterium]|nr:hypothetical protein AGMMS50262_16440 [Bacteroidia bacterium]